MIEYSSFNGMLLILLDVLYKKYLEIASPAARSST